MSYGWIGTRVTPSFISWIQLCADITDTEPSIAQVNAKPDNPDSFHVVVIMGVNTVDSTLDWMDPNLDSNSRTPNTIPYADFKKTGQCPVFS